MSLTERAVVLALLVAAGAAGWWRLTAYHEARGYKRAQQEAAQAAEVQRESNRLRARAAEGAYTAAAQVRERFIVTTVKEVQHATDNLAGCTLSPRAVRLLNDAAQCARQGGPAACGAGDGLRNPS